MYILLCGKQGSGKRETTTKLRTYFGYRGQACYAYDYLQPVYQMHDAVYIVGKQYGLNRTEPTDFDLISHLVEWGNNNSSDWGGWARCAKDHVDGITKRWDDLKMFYVAIIQGLPFAENLKMFPNSYKVLLKCDRDVRHTRVTNISRTWMRENHPIEVGFDDCAVSDIFDLVVDTESKNPDEVAKEIGNNFHDKLLSGLEKTKDSAKPKESDNTPPPKPAE